MTSHVKYVLTKKDKELITHMQSSFVFLYCLMNTDPKLIEEIIELGKHSNKIKELLTKGGTND